LRPRGPPVEELATTTLEVPPRVAPPPSLSTWNTPRVGAARLPRVDREPRHPGHAHRRHRHCSSKKSMTAF
jgi:hypothetical protein